MSDPAPTPPTDYSVFKHYLITFPAPYVAQVEINRPEKLNAFTESMWLELPPLFAALTSDPSARAILLSGRGRAFSAGLDLYSLAPPLLPFLGSPSASTSTSTADPARLALSLRSFILAFQSSVSSIASCPKPVIALHHGISYGLAIDISVCADIRLCSSDATFAVKEVEIGLAADIGTLSRLGKVVGGGSWVKEVCLSGRVWGAREAGVRGFVSGVVEGEREAVLARGVELGSAIAEKSPVAVRGTKELLDWSRDRSVEDGLKYTALWNSAALQTEDLRAAIEAVRTKKKATFAKL